MNTKYSNPEHTNVTIKYDDGRVTTGEKQQLINRGYLNADAVIEPYETAEETNAREYEEARILAQSDCFTALQAMTHTYADGRTVQVRPQDEANFRRQIAKGTGRDWIMANNTIAPLTVVEMEEAVASGIAQGEVIYDEYMAALSAL